MRFFLVPNSGTRATISQCDSRVTKIDSAQPSLWVGKHRSASATSRSWPEMLSFPSHKFITLRSTSKPPRWLFRLSIRGFGLVALSPFVKAHKQPSLPLLFLSIKNLSHFQLCKMSSRRGCFECVEVEQNVNCSSKETEDRNVIMHTPSW